MRTHADDLTELTPSSPDNPLETLRARLRGDGCLYLPGLLPPSEITAVAEQIQSVLVDHGWLARAPEGTDLLLRRATRPGGPGWWRLYQHIQALEALHRLAHHRALTTLVRRLIGGPVLNHPRRQVTMTPPGYWIPAHQEHLNVQGTPDVLTAWLLFTTLPTGAGVQVRQQPGPHRLLPVYRYSHGGVAVTAATDTRPRWRTSEAGYAAGDVVLIHALAVRRLPVNRTPFLWISAELRFQPAYEPIVKASLLPHHYPRVAGWPILTRGWSTRRWVRTRLVKHIVPFTVPPDLAVWHELLPTPQARLVDTDE